MFKKVQSALPALVALALACNGSATEPVGGGVHERWYQVQPGWAWARPAVFGNTVFFGTGDGQVVARDVSSGTPRWSAKVGTQPINGANLLARSGVVVAPVASYTVALDALSGSELWRYEAPMDTVGRATGSLNPGQVVLSRIDADDETVYIPAWGASVSAVDIRTGMARWVWQPGKMEGDTATSGVFRSGSMGARVSGDTVFATVWHYVNRFGGTSEAWVVALDRRDGHEFWRIRLPYQGSGVLIATAPEVYRNLVIVHTLSARTFAIDRTTGQIAWMFRSAGATVTPSSGPALFGDVVYVDGGDDHVYALRAADGAVIWRSPFPTQTSKDLLVTDRRITFSNGGTLFILDRVTGKRIAETTQPRTHDPLFASAATFSNGSIFITVGDGAWAFEEP